jgi:NADH:ubiquinone oxidoreductase subunit K
MIKRVNDLPLQIYEQGNDMNKLKLALTSLVVMGANSAYAATVTYDAADITGTITNIQTTAVAVMGAFITLGLTVMFYRKIRGLASRG